MEGASPRCTNDYIEVRDGPNGKSSLIDKFCGSLEPKPVISSANSVYLFFVSNDKFQFQGFRGTYRIVSEGEPSVMSFFVMLCYVTVYVTLCYVILRCVALRFVLLFYVMLRYVMSVH